MYTPGGGLRVVRILDRTCACVRQPRLGASCSYPREQAGRASLTSNVSTVSAPWRSSTVARARATSDRTRRFEDAHDCVDVQRRSSTSTCRARARSGDCWSEGAARDVSEVGSEHDRARPECWQQPSTPVAPPQHLLRRTQQIAIFSRDMTQPGSQHGLDRGSTHAHSERVESISCVVPAP